MSSGPQRWLNFCCSHDFKIQIEDRILRSKILLLLFQFKIPEDKAQCWKSWSKFRRNAVIMCEIMLNRKLKACERVNPK